jgi:hypothetical protein
MSTIRETIEDTYAANAFAERGLTKDAQILLKGESRQTAVKADAVKQIEKRPRPTLHAK